MPWLLALPLTTSERDWLLALLALWAALLFGGFALGRPTAANTRRMPAWTRIGSSLALVVAGWSWYAFTRTQPPGTFALLIALGMTLGCIGDIFLAEVVPLPQPVLGGMVAFGLGHVAYIAALLLVGNAGGLNAPAPRIGAWAAWLLVGFLGWYAVVYRGTRKPTTLHRAALPYALLLASTAGLATGLALQSPAFVPAAIGAGLFLLSDLILAAELFNGVRFPLIGDVIWLTYGPAQMLLVYSVAGALRVLAA